MEVKPVEQIDDINASALDATVNEQHLESMIDKVTKKKIPQKREKLKGAKSHHTKQNKMNNLPPKRMKAADMGQIFPTIGIESEE